MTTVLAPWRTAGAATGLEPGAAGATRGPPSHGFQGPENWPENESSPARKGLVSQDPIYQRLTAMEATMTETKGQHAPDGVPEDVLAVLVAAMTCCGCGCCCEGGHEGTLHHEAGRLAWRYVRHDAVVKCGTWCSCAGCGEYHQPVHGQVKVAERTLEDGTVVEITVATECERKLEG
jgi:hypothetical protein